MTDHAPTHLDADTLADLHEGLLDRDHGPRPARPPGRLRRSAGPTWPRSTGVRGPAGRGRRRSEPMPEDWSRRLDRALADAAAEPGQHRGHPQRHPAAGAAARRARAGMRLLQAAAVVVLVLAGGAVAVSALRGSGDGDGTATSAAGAPARPTSEPRPTAATRSPPAAGDWTKATVDAPRCRSCWPAR